MALTVALADACFPGQQAMGLAQENLGEAPKRLTWEREGLGAVKVFTDQRMKEAAEDPALHKIGMLIEPPALRPWHYDDARELAGSFEAIFTYDRRMVDADRFLFYPFGGSWIRDWGLFEKSRDISIISSLKDVTEGHLLRREIIREFGAFLEPFGEPYRSRFASKAEALRPYRFSVVVESERLDWYFTEKLIDCLSQGTVPIYWGCPDIGQFFDPRGIIGFSSLEEMAAILPALDEREYSKRLPYVQANLERAGTYRVAEDWLMERHPGYFYGLE